MVEVDTAGSATNKVGIKVISQQLKTCSWNRLLEMNLCNKSGRKEVISSKRANKGNRFLSHFIKIKFFWVC
jgi:hypothetical protein